MKATTRSEYAVLAAISRHRTEVREAATLRVILARVPVRQIPEVPDALDRLIQSRRVRRGFYNSRCFWDTRDLQTRRRA